MRPQPLLSLLGSLTLAAGLWAQEEAPVPASVAFPRPTAAEVALAEQSLASYKAALGPEMASIVKRFPEMIEVRPPRTNSAIVPSLSRGFFQKHQDNLAVARQGDIDVLFMGDSITDWWRRDDERIAGKPVFDKWFGDLKVANFGIAGDTTQGVLYRLQNGEGEGFSPKAIMLMIGTNNAGRNTSEEIAEGVGAIVMEMQKDFPAAKILLLAIFPRAEPDSSLRAINDGVNAIISRLHDGERVFYMDIGHVFLDADGSIPRDVMPDLLHPSGKGYELWAEAVNEPLRALL